MGERNSTMNGIERIIAQIMETAQTEAKNILAEANYKSKRIAASCEQQAKEAYCARIRAGVQENELRIQRLRKGNAMEAKKRILALKQELIDQAFFRAMELLETMDEADYISFLAYLASNAAESGTETVLFNEEDRARIGNRVVAEANRIRQESGEHGALVLGDETRLIRSGLILKHGLVEINCSFEKMMELRRSELAASVAAILFH